MDGPTICTNGSYERNGGICHAYFRLPDNGYCYHTSTTRTTCPATLSPLSVEEADRICLSRQVLRNPNTVSGGTVGEESNSDESISNSQTTQVDDLSATILTYSDAADYIGRAVTRLQRMYHLVESIGIAFSYISDLSLEVSEAEAFDFWTRARGSEILAMSRNEGRCQMRENGFYANACFAAMLLVSKMPVPDSPASHTFWDTIGVSGFIEENLNGIRLQLENSLRFFFMGHHSGAASAIIQFFARNWNRRFPAIVGESPLLKRIALIHEIKGYDRIHIRQEISDSRDVELWVSRGEPLASLTHALQDISAARLRRGIREVNFIGELAYGHGLIRELFSVVGQSVTSTNEAEALFAQPEDSQYVRMIPNPQASLSMYQSFGKFLALSVLSQLPIPVNLPVAFFRKLLGESVSIDQIRRELDAQWAVSAQRYMDAQTEEELLSFSLGEPEPFPGSDAEEPVTLTNRHAQIQQAIGNMICGNLQAEFAAIAEGFFFIVPRHVTAGVSGEDLQTMIVGIREISADALIANIHGSLNGNRMNWLHQIIRDFTPEQRQRFLQFVTGLSVLPATGSRQVGISVLSYPRSFSGVLQYPRARTCAQELHIPDYDSIVEMREIFTNVLNLAFHAEMSEHY